MLQLEYLISPDVMYWEMQTDEGVAARKKAQDEVYASPIDATAQKKLEKAQAYLGFADDQPAEAKRKYQKEYVPATFPIAIDGDTDTYFVPPATEVKEARLAITNAKAKLEEAVC